jgi:hypothetical protein
MLQAAESFHNSVFAFPLEQTRANMVCAATGSWVFDLNRLTILLQALSFIVVLILIRGGSWVWMLALIILLALVYLSERAAKKKLSTENKATPP